MQAKYSDTVFTRIINLCIFRTDEFCVLIQCFDRQKIISVLLARNRSRPILHTKVSGGKAGKYTRDVRYYIKTQPVIQIMPYLLSKRVYIIYTELFPYLSLSLYTSIFLVFFSYLFLLSPPFLFLVSTVSRSIEPVCAFL